MRGINKNKSQSRNILEKLENAKPEVICKAPRKGIGIWNIWKCIYGIYGKGQGIRIKLIKLIAHFSVARIDARR